MLKIGDFSKLSRISVRTLRHYADLGLLEPKTVDPFTGYRYYAEDQLLAAGRIAALRQMGFGLTDIAELLRRYEDPQALAGCLAAHRPRLQAEVQAAQHRLTLLDSTIDRLRKDKAMKYDVSLKTLPERYVASVRMTLPTYAHEHDLWSVMASETAALGLVPDDPCYCSVTYHDGEFKETDVDAEAQKTVRGRYPDTGHVRFKTVPPVTFASAIHKGSYELLGEANAAVAAWVQANGYAFDGLAFHLYHVSPRDTQNPGDFVTEVCYPVRKA